MLICYPSGLFAEVSDKDGVQSRNFSSFAHLLCLSHF